MVRKRLYYCEVLYRERFLSIFSTDSFRSAGLQAMNGKLFKHFKLKVGISYQIYAESSLITLYSGHT